MRRLTIVVALACGALRAQDSPIEQFEKKIRPVLVARCYGCHSAQASPTQGGLRLDSSQGIRQGGNSGPLKGSLLRALSHQDASLKMPPGKPLPAETIAEFATWIANGAPVPETLSSAAKPAARLWSLQPPIAQATPPTRNSTWARTEIDRFVLAKLEGKGLTPQPEADRKTVIRRLYFDLTGLPPTRQQVDTFVDDKAPTAYERLVDDLLKSPRYGERWARHWLDVARYADSNNDAVNSGIKFAWSYTYRDWVIGALNEDLPYDKFLQYQLAADRLSGLPARHLAALGFLSLGREFPKSVPETVDDRIDAVTRGMLGFTVACARCHDHKFDPIPTKDYYGLVGVFASTMRTERPLFDVDPVVEARSVWVQNRLFDLRYSANLLTGEASTVEGSEARVTKWKAEIETLKAEMEGYREKYPKLVANLEKYWTYPAPRVSGAPAPPQQNRRRANTSTEPFANAVYDAAQYVDGSDEHYTFINLKPNEPRDVPVLLHGNVATPGPVVPRHFLSVLSNGDGNFKQGSGRAELADRMFGDASALTARVVVNRVWDWHFGRPLVATPSDFGVQGEKPTDPKLLDDLAARFIANGWSFKWLHREIMLSTAYRQSSKPRADGEKIDTLNTMVWRMNPRRLDIESYRDTLLRAAGRLDPAMYGPSEDIDAATSVKRTVYGRVSRGRLAGLLKTYDFPDPMQTAGGRDLTTNALQQFFVMNSAFMHEESLALAKLLG